MGTTSKRAPRYPSEQHKPPPRSRPPPHSNPPNRIVVSARKSQQQQQGHHNGPYLSGTMTASSLTETQYRGQFGMSSHSTHSSASSSLKSQSTRGGLPNNSGSYISSTSTSGGGSGSSSSSNKLVYASPRIELDDAQLFPNSPTKRSLANTDKRWQKIGEQAGSHKQDSSVLHVSRRHMTPSVLKAGVPPQVANRIKELHLRLEQAEDMLPEWLDVIAAKFQQLEHLVLTRDQPESPSAQPSRLRRLYILYRLPHLVSIDKIPVTKSERRLARPDDPNGHKVVSKEQWFDPLENNNNNNNKRSSSSKKSAKQSSKKKRSASLPAADETRDFVDRVAVEEDEHDRDENNKEANISETDSGQGYELDLDLADAIERITSSPPRGVRSLSPPTSSRNHRSNTTKKAGNTANSKRETLSPGKKNRQQQTPKAKGNKSSSHHRRSSNKKGVDTDDEHTDRQNAADLELVECDSTVTSAYGYGHWSGACFAPFQVCTSSRTPPKKKQQSATNKAKQPKNGNHTDNNKSSRKQKQNPPKTSSFSIVPVTPTHEESTDLPPTDPGDDVDPRQAKSFKYSSLVDETVQKQEAKHRRKLFKDTNTSTSQGANGSNSVPSSSKRSHKYSRLLVELNDGEQQKSQSQKSATNNNKSSPATAHDKSMPSQKTPKTRPAGDTTKKSTSSNKPISRDSHSTLDEDEVGTMTGVSIAVAPDANSGMSVTTLPSVLQRQADKMDAKSAAATAKSAAATAGKSTVATSAAVVENESLAARRNLAGVTIDVPPTTPVEAKKEPINKTNGKLMKQQEPQQQGQQEQQEQEQQEIVATPQQASFPNNLCCAVGAGELRRQQEIAARQQQQQQQKRPEKAKEETKKPEEKKRRPAPPPGRSPPTAPQPKPAPQTRQQKEEMTKRILQAAIGSMQANSTDETNTMDEGRPTDPEIVEMVLNKLGQGTQQQKPRLQQHQLETPMGTTGTKNDSKRGNRSGNNKNNSSSAAHAEAVMQKLKGIEATAKNWASPAPSDLQIPKLTPTSADLKSKKSKNQKLLPARAAPAPSQEPAREPLSSNKVKLNQKEKKQQQLLEQQQQEEEARQQQEEEMEAARQKRQQEREISAALQRQKRQEIADAKLRQRQQQEQDMADALRRVKQQEEEMTATLRRLKQQERRQHRAPNPASSSSNSSQSQEESMTSDSASRSKENFHQSQEESMTSDSASRSKESFHQSQEESTTSDSFQSKENLNELETRLDQLIQNTHKLPPSLKLASSIPDSPKVSPQMSPADQRIMAETVSRLDENLRNILDLHYQKSPDRRSVSPEKRIRRSPQHRSPQHRSTNSSPDKKQYGNLHPSSNTEASPLEKLETSMANLFASIMSQMATPRHQLPAPATHTPTSRKQEKKKDAFFGKEKDTRLAKMKSGDDDSTLFVLEIEQKEVAESLTNDFDFREHRAIQKLPQVGIDAPSIIALADPSVQSSITVFKPTKPLLKLAAVPTSPPNQHPPDEEFERHNPSTLSRHYDAQRYADPGANLLSPDHELVGLQRTAPPVQPGHPQGFQNGNINDPSIIHLEDKDPTVIDLTDKSTIVTKAAKSDDAAGGSLKEDPTVINLVDVKSQPSERPDAQAKAPEQSKELLLPSLDHTEAAVTPGVDTGGNAKDTAISRQGSKLGMVVNLPTVFENDVPSELEAPEATDAAGVAAAAAGAAAGANAPGDTAPQEVSNQTVTNETDGIATNKTVVGEIGPPDKKADKGSPPPKEIVTTSSPANVNPIFVVLSSPINRDNPARDEFSYPKRLTPKAGGTSGDFPSTSINPYPQEVVVQQHNASERGKGQGLIGELLTAKPKDSNLSLLFQRELFENKQSTTPYDCSRLPKEITAIMDQLDEISRDPVPGKPMTPTLPREVLALLEAHEQSGLDSDKAIAYLPNEIVTKRANDTDHLYPPASPDSDGPPREIRGANANEFRSSAPLPPRKMPLSIQERVMLNKKDWKRLGNRPPNIAKEVLAMEIPDDFDEGYDIAPTSHGIFSTSQISPSNETGAEMWYLSGMHQFSRSSTYSREDRTPGATFSRDTSGPTFSREDITPGGTFSRDHEEFAGVHGLSAEMYEEHMVASASSRMESTDDTPSEQMSQSFLLTRAQQAIFRLRERETGTFNHDSRVDPHPPSLPSLQHPPSLPSKVLIKQENQIQASESRAESTDSLANKLLAYPLSLPSKIDINQDIASQSTERGSNVPSKIVLQNGQVSPSNGNNSSTNNLPPYKTSLPSKIVLKNAQVSPSKGNSSSANNPAPCPASLPSKIDIGKASPSKGNNSPSYAWRGGSLPSKVAVRVAVNAVARSSASSRQEHRSRDQTATSKTFVSSRQRESIQTPAPSLPSKVVVNKQGVNPPSLPSKVVVKKDETNPPSLPSKVVAKKEGGNDATTNNVSASKSLSSPFPMQFRARLAKSLKVSTPSGVPDSETAQAKSPSKDARAVTSKTQGGKPSPTKLPPHQTTVDTKPSPSLNTHTNGTPNSASKVFKPVASPLLKSRAKKAAGKSAARTSGDLPPHNPASTRRNVASISPRSDKMQQALTRWKQQRTARSSSVMDGTDDDEEDEDHDATDENGQPISYTE